MRNKQIKSLILLCIIYIIAKSSGVFALEQNFIVTNSYKYINYSFINDTNTSTFTIVNKSSSATQWITLNSTYTPLKENCKIQTLHENNGIKKYENHTMPCDCGNYVELRIYGSNDTCAYIQTLCNNIYTPLSPFPLPYPQNTNITKIYEVKLFYDLAEAGGGLAIIPEIIKGGGSITNILEAYNPSVYEEIKTELPLLLKSGSLTELINNGFNLCILTIKYIFQQPATISSTLE
jgi:hypothetical protein